MDEQSKTLPKTNKIFILGPLSVIASIAAFLSIPSIYGAVIGCTLGIMLGWLASRHNQKAVGIIGIGLNLIVLVVTAVMLHALSSYRSE